MQSMHTSYCMQTMKYLNAPHLFAEYAEQAVKHAKQSMQNSAAWHSHCAGSRRAGVYSACGAYPFLCGWPRDPSGAAPCKRPQVTPRSGSWQRSRADLSESGRSVRVSGRPGRERVRRQGVDAIMRRRDNWGTSARGRESTRGGVAQALRRVRGMGGEREREREVDSESGSQPSESAGRDPGPIRDIRPSHQRRAGRSPLSGSRTEPPRRRARRLPMRSRRGRRSRSRPTRRPPLRS